MQFLTAFLVGARLSEVLAHPFDHAHGHVISDTTIWSPYAIAPPVCRSKGLPFRAVESSKPAKSTGYSVTNPQGLLQPSRSEAFESGDPVVNSKWNAPVGTDHIERMLEATYIAQCPIKSEISTSSIFGILWTRQSGLHARGYQNIRTLSQLHFVNDTGTYGYVWSYEWCEVVRNYGCHYEAEGHVSGILSELGLSIEMIVVGAPRQFLPSLSETCVPIGQTGNGFVASSCVITRVAVTVPVHPE